MLNARETEIITNGYMHLQSRIIYAACLATFADNGEIVLDYVTILNFISIINPDGSAAYRPNADEINRFILELMRYELLAPLEAPSTMLDDGTPFYNGVRCRLPARFSGKITETSFRLYRMHADWQPSSQFTEQAVFSGLNDSSYSLSELNDFISYWITTRTVKDDAHWNLAFISFLKRKRHEI